MAPTKERPATKSIATNREARHEYFVLEALETGVELKGTEVKSLRAGGVNLKDSWVDIEDGELLVKGMHISPYDHGNLFNQDPMRVRRLLAHKSEIRRLHQHPCAALALFQAWPRKNGSGPVQRQKAVRQACRCRPARCKALH